LFSRQLSAGESCSNDDKGDRDHRRHSIHALLAESNLFEARFILEVKDQLNLSKKQEEKIENLMLEHETSVIQLSAEIKVKELQFATYLKSGKMERKQVEKFIREISKEKADVIIHHLNHLLDIRAVLSADQLKKLVELGKKKYSRPDRPPKKPLEKP
jgi:Spy/CpxP family protein refolding chaperone